MFVISKILLLEVFIFIVLNPGLYVLNSETLYNAAMISSAVLNPVNVFIIL